MVERVLCDDEIAHCHEKASTKVHAFLKGLEGLPDRDKFIAMAEHFKKVARCAALASENLDPDKFHQRKNNELPRDSLRCFAKTSLRGQFEMAAILDAMKSLQAENQEPLSLVNGTSHVFAECSQILIQEGCYLETGVQFIEKGIVPEEFVPRQETFVSVICYHS
jgi:hypothetical protein